METVRELPFFGGKSSTSGIWCMCGAFAVVASNQPENDRVCAEANHVCYQFIFWRKCLLSCRARGSVFTAGPHTV